MKAYDSYKDSEVEWIGKIPNHWNKLGLGKIGNLYGGLTGKSGEDFRSEDNKLNRPYIPFTNIFNNTYISKDHFQFVVINEGESQNVVHRGDLFFLMSSEGYDDLGKSSILIDNVEGELYLNSFCKGFRISRKDVNPKFLNYQLLGDAHRKLISVEGNGFTRINLRQDNLKSLPVFIPPLAEQQQIVSFLDEKTLLIDSLIEKTHCKIDFLKEKRTSLINEVVTKGLNPNIEMKDSGVEWIGEIPCQWELKQLKHISEFQNGYGFKSDKWVDSGIPIIRIQNLNGGEHFNFYEEKIGLEKYLVSEGDLLFSWSGNVGTSFGPFMWNKKGRHYLNQHIFLLNQKVDVNLKWYFYTLNRLTRFIEEYYTSGVIGLVHITKDELGGSKIPYPPISEQQQIVEYLDKQTQKIDKTIAVEKERVDLLKEYRKSLISSVVTGKIKVTEDA